MKGRWTEVFTECQDEIDIHVGTCWKNPLNKLEWEGSPYIGENNLPTTNLLSCPLCGLEIINTKEGNFHWRGYLNGVKLNYAG